MKRLPTRTAELKPPAQTVLMVTLAAALLSAGIAANAAHVPLTQPDGGNPRWESMPIPYFVNYEGSARILNGSEFIALDSAFQVWQNAPDTEIEFENMGQIYTGFGADGFNTVTFAEDPSFLFSGTLAITFNYFDTSGPEPFIVESDIVFNSEVPISTSAEFATFDVESIAIHEIGHMLGLAHTGMVSSLMSPFGTEGAVHRRKLTTDDQIGIRRIYPAVPDAEAPPTGSATGTISRVGGPVFGAHVVALDNEGTAVASVLSDQDGSFEFNFLPVGSYTFYAEPLIGTVRSQNLPFYFADIRTNFGVTFFGDVPTTAGSEFVEISDQSVTSGVDITVLPLGITGFRLTEPFNGIYVDRGAADPLVLGGDHLDDTVVYTPSAPTITLEDRAPGGYLNINAPTTTNFTVRIAENAAVGPKMILGEKADTRSIMTGAVIVTAPSPRITALSESSGTMRGGTLLQIEGQNFRPGIKIEFGGIPATSVEVLNPSLLQVTTPANIPGPANIVAVNADGTSGVLPDGFDYDAVPPTITSVYPEFGRPGTLVLIGGIGFGDDYQNLTVTFNGQPAPIVTSTNTYIQTVVPYQTSTGDVVVSMFETASSGGTFTVLDATESSNPAPEEAMMIDVSSGDAVPFLDGSGFDDDIEFVALPFDFALFRDTYPEQQAIAVTMNGWMSLEPSVTEEWANPHLPASTVTREFGSTGLIAEALIAPFFDDLAFPPGASVTTLVTGNAPDRIFVVEWANVSILNEALIDVGADVTFQVQLYEGSNDLRFVYGPVSGDRSDGSSATIGIQNFDRTVAEQISYNAPVISEGVAVTFRFDDGSYTIEGNPTPPGKPEVTDGGTRTASQTELIASWTTPATGGQVESYEYAIGTNPGGTDVREFTPVAANSVVASGLSLQNGTMYYISVRGRSDAGVAGMPGSSDGILVDTSFLPATFTFPVITHGNGAFAGIAVMAEEDTDVVMRAINPDGSLTTGLEITNPAVVTIDAGKQWSELVHETFGLAAFDGWVELQASTPTTRAYASMGSNNLSFVDGVGPASPSTDFYLVHAGAVATLVNPATQPVTATLTPLGGGSPEQMQIPGRSRISTILATAARVTAPSPVIGLETYRTADEDSMETVNLALGNGVSQARANLVFPHAVVGGGYSSRLTAVNTSAAPVDFEMTFRGVSAPVTLEPGVATAISVGETFGLGPADPLVTGAVRLTPVSGSVNILVGSMDIELPTTLVGVPASTASQSIVFPHMADLGGFFTGIAVAAGSTGAQIDIEVYSRTGILTGADSFSVEPDGELARLVSELVDGLAPQNGGFIRLESDTPIWAWEIYGTLEAMASGPPL